jgi:hypothetical protein
MLLDLGPMLLHKALIFAALLTIGPAACDSSHPNANSTSATSSGGAARSGTAQAIDHPIAGSAMGGAGASGPVGGAGSPPTPAGAMDAAVSDAMHTNAPEPPEPAR